MLRKVPLIFFLALICGSARLAQPIIIHSISFEGNKSLSSTLLKGQLRASGEGSPYRLEDLLMELQNLEHFYRDRGFLRAKIGEPQVEIRTAEGGAEAAAIRVPVSEGPLFALGNLQIKNALALQAGALYQMAPLREGESYRRDKIRSWIGRITENYYSMGYIRFEASLDEEIHNFRHVVDCIIEFNEGNAYRVGKIDVETNQSIDTTAFRKFLLLGEGSVYDPQMLSHSIHFLNMMRVFEPLSKTDVEIEVNDAERTVDLVFHVVPLRKPSSSRDN